MPTYLIKAHDGSTIFMKGDFGEHCKCGGVNDVLCDYPVGKNKTCDAKLCHNCSYNVGDDLDYCKGHYKMWLDYTEKLKSMKMEKLKPANQNLEPL